MYSIGNRFQICGNVYILATVGDNKILLISPETGRYWGKKVECVTTSRITEADIRQMIGSFHTETIVIGLTKPFPPIIPLPKEVSVSKCSIHSMFAEFMSNRSATRREFIRACALDFLNTLGIEEKYADDLTYVYLSEQ